MLSGLLCLCLYSTLANSTEGKGKEGGEQPNIIYIMFDDLGYGDLGSYGSDYILTPNIDALAAQGLKLTSYYTNGPYCSPTRVSLLSAQYPMESGYQWLSHGSQGVNEQIRNLPEMLKEHGYVTGHFGKWHSSGESWGTLDVPTMHPHFLPTEMGFDKSERYNFFAAPPRAQHYDPYVKIDESSVWETPTGLDTDLIINGNGGNIGGVIDFINTHKNGPDPYFANIWLYAPHWPLNDSSPPEILALYDDASISDDLKQYAAMMTYADQEIQKIFDAIDNDFTNTLVIITSDNGGGTGASTNTIIYPDGQEGLDQNGVMQDLRGFKGDFYEGGTRAPFIARWDGHIPSGAINNSVMLSYDLIPTLEAIITGNPKPSLENVSGRNKSDVLFSEADVPREDITLWSSVLNARGDIPGTGITEKFAVRDGDWKFVFVSANQFGLYDFSEGDRTETNNLIEAHLDQALGMWDYYWQQREVLTNFSDDLTATPIGALDPVDGGHIFDYEYFGDPNSALRFDYNDYFGLVARNEFSLRFEVTPNTRIVGATKEVLMAKEDDAWKLALMPSGQLQLTLRGYETRSEDAELVTYTIPGSTVLTPGKTYDITFISMGWGNRDTNNQFIIYVNGNLEFEELGLHRLHVVPIDRKTIYVGNNLFDPSLERFPFAGTIANIRMNTVRLNIDEVNNRIPQLVLRDSDGDSIINAVDNCNFDYNPGQEDLDGDTQGDVCDDDVEGDGILNTEDPDDDNDGLPDDFENEHEGLDPFDPSDAGDDEDNDGLNNLDEFNAGTNLNDPDTDDDGIIDGLDRDPTSNNNNLCLGQGADAHFTFNVAGVSTCAASNSITVDLPAGVDIGGDLLLISPKVIFSEFGVADTGKLKIISRDPMSTDP